MTSADYIKVWKVGRPSYLHVLERIFLACGKTQYMAPS